MLEGGLEKSFISRLLRFSDKIQAPNKDSVQEGFDYFSSDEFNEKIQKNNIKIEMPFFKNGLSGFFKLFFAFAFNLFGLIRGQNKNYRDIEDIVENIENNKTIPETNPSVSSNFPNNEIWNSLISYAWKKHRVIIGFTKLPNEFIFKNKAVLFGHALVCVQEMRRKKINKAPKVDAGAETIRVYNTLGKATNDIANWLRKKYGVVCMASHPLGGLVDTTPLAKKAGLGFIGHSGLLITPQFGPRCRISPIFIDYPIFKYTDNTEHDWIKDFCDTCHRCEIGCPQNAIYKEKIENSTLDKPHLNRFIAIDREKCFIFFRKTMGCSACIKNCPFSDDPNHYERTKSQILLLKGKGLKIANT